MGWNVEKQIPNSLFGSQSYLFTFQTNSYFLIYDSPTMFKENKLTTSYYFGC